MSDSLKLVCETCGQANRIPILRLGEGPRCGSCGDPLVTGKVAELDVLPYVLVGLAEVVLVGGLGKRLDQGFDVDVVGVMDLGRVGFEADFSLGYSRYFFKGFLDCFYAVSAAHSFYFKYCFLTHFKGQR